MTATIWSPERTERTRHTLKSARQMAFLFGDAAKIEWRGDGRPAVTVYATCDECAEPFGVAHSLYRDESIDDLRRAVAEHQSSIAGFRLYTATIDRSEVSRPKTVRHPMVGTLRADTTCEVCGLTAGTFVHPCRFDRACSCWYGEPCQPKTH